MSNHGREDELSVLLQETGHAHHLAFASVGGEDPAWARWYGEYLSPRLAGLGFPDLPADVLSDLLTEAEEHRRGESQDNDWPTYYARWLLERWLGQEDPA